jgi:hypothetical protein
MTKTLMTTAIVLFLSSLNASANFQPWEGECSKHRQNEVHGQPADVQIGPYYRHESQVVEDTPDAAQHAARETGPFYLRG